MKAVLVDRAGGTLAASAPLHGPLPGWAEQEVEEWWQATVAAIWSLHAEPQGAAGLTRLEGIGLSGQMHGTVVLDRSGRPRRPAIVWADRRSDAEADVLHSAFRANGLSTRLGGLVAPGFLAATIAAGLALRWLRQQVLGNPNMEMFFRLLDRAVALLRAPRACSSCRTCLASAAHTRTRRPEAP